MVYDIARAVGGGYIALCRGNEIGVTDTVVAASLLCADDAISAYPEAAPDVVYDVAAESGQMVGNVRHMMWFQNNVAAAILESWPLDHEIA